MQPQCTNTFKDRAELLSDRGVELPVDRQTLELPQEYL